MGLLDDAIREHLDLKRRRGADPEEIERAEREALGPVRRAPEDAEVVGAAVQEPPGYDDGEAQWDDEPFADEEPYSQTAVAEPEQLQDDEPIEDVSEPTAFADPHAADASLPPQESPDLALPDENAQPAERPSANEPLDPEEEPFPAEQAHGDEPASGPAPPVPASPPPERSAEDHSEETVEYDVEGALDKDEKHDDDVLEGTPEFLQDTPDHDRLWFEQRPPRDFDMGD